MRIQMQDTIDGLKSGSSERNTRIQELEKEVAELTRQKQEWDKDELMYDRMVADLREQVLSLQHQMAAVVEVSPALEAGEDEGAIVPNPGTLETVPAREHFSESEEKLLTAGELHILLPNAAKNAQNYRDWAKSAIAGKGGREKLAKLGYEAIKDGDNYLFRKIG